MSEQLGGSRTFLKAHGGAADGEWMAQIPRNLTDTAVEGGGATPKSDPK